MDSLDSQKRLETLLWEVIKPKIPVALNERFTITCGKIIILKNTPWICDILLNFITFNKWHLQKCMWDCKNSYEKLIL